jgi:peptidoglycan/xylan/chitin deacetylase (PgdA/CDA1 family)
VRRELILNFHGIGTPHCDVSSAERLVWMSRENFVGLLDRIVALREAHKTPIAITFDDGNDSDVSVALPELCERRLSATFFLCAGRLSARGYLGPVAIRELLSAGMGVGSHGMHHRNWRGLGETELAEEIGAARRRLEDACGQPVNEVAIPFGSYDRRVLGKLRTEGVSCVYTSDRGLARGGAWLQPRNTLGAGAKPKDVADLLARGPRLQTALRHGRTLYKRLR